MAELVCGTGDRDAWLTARRQGITATDLPVILGLVTWDSPFSLYWRKKHILPEVEASDRMRLGSWLEREIAVEWRRQAGVQTLHPGGLYRSDARPWQLATPDYCMRQDRHDSPMTAVLECKTSATRDGWGKGDDFINCGCPTENEAGQKIAHGPHQMIPAHVWAQVLWQMDTLGVPVGHVAVVFLPSGEFRSYTIEHPKGCDLTGQFLPPDGKKFCDQCIDIAFMRAEAGKFWDRLNDDDPPPVDGLQATTDALRVLHAGAVKGKQAEIPPSIQWAWDAACEGLAESKALKIEAENTLRQLMGDATVAVTGDRVIARREVFKRAGYEVGPCEVDRLVRVKPREDKTDG